MKRYVKQFAGLALLGLFVFGCDSIVSQQPVAEEEFSAEQTIQGSEVMENENLPCQIQCIDPEAPEYIKVDDERVVGWGGRDDERFTKTVTITYYNTLTDFVLKVKSSNGIADVLMGGESIKDFEGTIDEDTWHQFTFPLDEDWQACDPWTAGLKVTGFGPPAYFAVAYQLIGECDEYTHPTLTLSVNPENAGAVTGAGKYPEGQEVELTATANEGFEFVNWTDGEGVEVSDAAAFTYTMPAGDITLTANFELIPDYYTLTLDANPADGGTVHGAGEYLEGQQVQITATANQGFEFVNWTDGEGAQVSDITDFTYTMPAGDITLTANFSEESVDNAFVTTWNTNLGEGTTVTLALAGSVDATINWGDGTITAVTTPGPHTHNYGVEGIYTVQVSGTVTAYNSLSNGGAESERQKLVSVDSWGDLGLSSLRNAFHSASNLVSVPSTTEGIEHVTDMGDMFSGATSFNADIGGWDVSNVTDMRAMFRHAAAFNQDIGDWDVSNVTIMASMFSRTPFNHDIGMWDVSNVSNMNWMFYVASDFNQNIGQWDVSNVIHMYLMFGEATSFNQDIGGWDVSSVTDMRAMFSQASSFNQNIGAWDVSKVTNMLGMFWYATSFNGNIGAWDVSQVSTMMNMFVNAKAFNQDIGGWNTASVTNMSGMFAMTESFNQDIGNWDVSRVTDMFRMFYWAKAFNRDLSGWCVELIPEKPTDFDTGATSWTLPDSRPVWGTCPVN